MATDKASRIELLSTEKRALLERRLRGQTGASGPGRVKPREHRDTAPLTFAQQRLWFLEHWDPGSAVYNVCIPLVISGPLDVPALNRSLNRVIQRHEVLRTYLLSTFSGEPSQVILPELEVDIPVVPWSVPENERLEFMHELTARETKQPLRLDQAPLFRPTLYRASPNEHLLFFVIHHIIYDGWSLGIFVKEWFYFYDAAVLGKDAQLADLPFQYGDFAAWQRDAIGDEAHRRQAAYWAHQLADRSGVLELMTDHPRPPHLTYNGKLKSLTIPAEIKRGFLELSRREGTTFYVATLAALSAMLHHYTGQADLIVGTPVSDRPYSETEPLIGYFVNTLPVRVRPSGELTFLELLHQVQDTMLNALNNRSLPFERVVEELQLERDTSRSPLFQVFFATQQRLLPPFHTQSLRLETYPLDNGTAMFELSLFLYEEGASDLIQYNTDLFEERTIELFGEHLVTVMRAVLENPRQQIGKYSVLGHREQSLLARWSRGPELELPPSCIHRRFREQAERTPNATAVAGNGGSLTYRQLDEQSNQLARYLTARGAQPGSRIGLCVERSPRLVLSLLAILKTGAAYVPLDQDYPASRLAVMLEDAKLSLLLTETPLRDRLPSREIPVALIDQDWDAVIAGESCAPPRDQASPHDLAYVIYTSGSTGRPKGVEVEHDSVVNFLESMLREPGLSSTDRLVAVTSISFDIAGLELYLPLLCGATVVLATREQATDAYQLARLLDDASASVLQATPATWRMLLDSGWRNPRKLKMLVGGEALPKDLAHALTRTGAELWNLYGPTEVTIWATLARILPDTESVSIGRPIANTQAYVLDSALRPVPIGGVGELYLGGRGVARGYLNAPQLTAERFIANPVPGSTSERLYRTGDRARYRNEGTLEYLGRTDQQIKLHGYRIELEEIEVALRLHAAVRAAAAALREDTPGDRRLVAYVVPDPNYRDGQTEASTQAEHVSDWLTLYDQVYKETETETALNTIGWNSSYTGQPIPTEEMLEQVEQTTNRVLALQPRRVLELGCGTGLHLARIAPHTHYYLGTDGSASALSALRRDADLASLPQVELEQRRAHDLGSLAAGSFDCVLINSVIQYFPDIEYLLEVLTQAARVLAPGGTIVVADVRNFRLLEAYHTSVQLYRAADEDSSAELRQAISHQLENENELLVAPAFFEAVSEHIPTIGSVQLHLRRGRFQNELTRFRYDAFLRSAEPASDDTGATWDWSKDPLTLTELASRLVQENPANVRLENVQNLRTSHELEAMALLARDDAPRSVAELRAALTQPASGVDPERLWALGEELGYHVQVGWSSRDEGALGSYFAAFSRTPARYVRVTASNANGPSSATSRRNSDQSPGFWRSFGNDLKQRRFTELLPEIRRFVQERLPSYMVPSTITILEALPLTPNGKLDRRALPAPRDLSRDLAQGYVEPRTDEERHLARIWADVLRVERVGREDDYFALGGDSVRSILLISRANEAGFAFTSKQLFENRTIAALLDAIQARQESTNETREEARRLPRVPDVAGLVPNLDEVEAVFPTTSYQRWGIRRYQALQDPGLYLIQPNFRIRNEQFRPDLFAEAWQRTVALHSALRTRFLWEGLPEPLQVVYKRARAEVNQLDLRHLPYEQQQQEIARFMAEDFRRGFLAEGPSHVRISLIRVADDDYSFVYSLDHLLQDGWSMSMFLHDTLDHYASLRDGTEPTLVSRRPYGDALCWAWQQDRKKALAFWKTMLAGFTTPNKIVTYDVPFALDNEVLCKEVALSARSSSSLRELCKQSQITFWNFIAGVWTLIMSVESGDDDIVFGLVVSGRPAHMEGIERTVGSLINLLPLRLRIDPEASFLSWMKELQPMMWELKNYEYADALGIWDESELRTAPLPFQSQITYMSQPLDEHTLKVGRAWAQGAMKTARTGVPLKLEVVPVAKIGLRVQYHKACFDERAIARIAESLVFLLQLIDDDPRRTIGDMKAQLRERWPEDVAAQ